MGKSKNGDRGADGAAGAGIRTTVTEATEATGATGAAGATGSWLPRFSHRESLTFIYLLIFINQSGQFANQLISRIINDDNLINIYII